MKFMDKIKNFLTKYKHGTILLYFFIYMIWFTYLEKNVTKYTVVYSKYDDLIPFMEIFVVPYILWFAFIFITVAYFFFTSKIDFYKCCAYLFIGMTICLIIYTIWPNGQNLRVDLDNLGRSNIFTYIVSIIYKTDTPTNVFPSIHVYNSIGASIAIRKSEKLRKIKWIQWLSIILTILISLSTVFIKQHSILDGLSAIILSIIMYIIVYVPNWSREHKPVEQEKLSNI